MHNIFKIGSIKSVQCIRTVQCPCYSYTEYISRITYVQFFEFTEISSYRNATVLIIPETAV